MAGALTLLGLLVGIWWPSSSLAQEPPPGVQVTVEAYGHDQTDGSDVGWLSPYPNPSLSDDPDRQSLSNARWDGSTYWAESAHAAEGAIGLCLSISNLEAAYSPVHTMAIGYTVTLQGATFTEDGSSENTFVLYQFSGAPDQTDITECFGVRTTGSATTIAPGDAEPSRWVFLDSEIKGWREIHSSNVAGTWDLDDQGLNGAIVNDANLSFFHPPATVSGPDVSVSSTFTIRHVDYSAVGVGIIDSTSQSGPPPARQPHLRCDVSERNNQVVLLGAEDSQGGGTGIWSRTGLDIQQDTRYTLTLEVKGTTARCLLNDEEMVTGDVPSLDVFPGSLHPALHVFEAGARFEDLTVLGDLTSPPINGPGAGSQFLAARPRNTVGECLGV